MLYIKSLLTVRNCSKKWERINCLFESPMWKCYN